MDCLTAQTMITSYVEGELCGENLKSFLQHVKKCSACKEELDIYYTLLEATRQLDEGIIKTTNFSQELDEKIEKDLNDIIKNEKWDASVNIVVTGTIVIILFLGVIKLLNIPFPIINTPPTWEEQKIHIEEKMIPYMYHSPIETERIDIK